MAFSFRRRQLVTAALVANALRPVPIYQLGIPAMGAGWLTSELAPHLLAVNAADTARELTRDDRDAMALALAAATTTGLAALIRQSMGAKDVVEDALVDGLGADYAAHLAPEHSELDLGKPWRQLILPFRIRNPHVEVLKDVRYSDAGDFGLLDIYRRRGSENARGPILLHVHGGGWSMGDKDYEGLPLMMHMAARGWVCVAINYRQGAKHPFPAHIIDVKRAVTWLREHGPEYGADPSYVAVSGGSAGGHLAALAGLSPNDPDYQPGFEASDTRVQAVVPHYGVYDFAGASGTKRAVQRRDQFLAPRVLQEDFATHRRDFEQASPLCRTRPDAPPFFVIHGAHDTMIESAEAELFVKRLREVSRQPVVHAELPGAQHAFDLFPSIRSAHVVRGVERFLRWTLAQHHAVSTGVRRRS